MGLVENAFKKSQTKGLLDQLVQDEVFSEVDRCFASRLAGSEEMGLFCSFLMAISRQGHLCVGIEDGRIFPDPDILNIEDPITLNVLREKILLGAKEARPQHGLIWNDSQCYLPKSWHYETQIISSLHNLTDPKPCLNWDSFQKLLDKDESLLSKQKEAIEGVFSSSLVLLCGGPGTGKTFTASRMIQILAASLQEGAKWKIALAAPTGKAALHLRSKLQLSFDHIEVITGTIHSLFSPRKEGGYDFVLIDEASMIDVQWMADILRRMKSGSRLCLMGDPDQLPPVEAGSLFHDLTEAPCLKKVVLDHAMRFESQNLLDFASALKAGDSSAITNLMSETIRHWDLDLEEYTAQKEILDYAERFFPSSAKDIPNPSISLKEMNRFRVLCALRRGRVGVDQLNEKIAERIFLKGRGEDWYTIPILITQNDAQQDLYNGQTGVMISHGRHLLGKVYFEDGRVFSPHQLPRYQYGYCLSVHKSQGSEFDRVLLILPSSSIGFGKELLYTAATRAKKELEIIGKISTLRKVMGKDSRRESGILRRLESGQKKGGPKVRPN